MNYDIIIIGGGIVGFATAYKLLLADKNLNILVLEKEGSPAKHQTGNNSGVIHSGIYYKPGSLKATNCRRGYKQLLDYCNENNIKYDLCGKIILATNEEELKYLDTLYERGKENGLEELKFIEQEQIKDYEPHAIGVRALHVPQTGIIDYREVTESYYKNSINMGCKVKFNEEVNSISTINNIVEVITSSSKYTSSVVVTCAGLQSDKLAEMTNEKIDLRIIPFRGEYYKLKEEKRPLVKSLIYPVPNPAFPFLGVHFTRMIDGEVEAGPNAVLSFKKEGYSKFSFSLLDVIKTFTWPGFIRIMGKYWKIGFGEFYRSYSKEAFVKALNKLIPEIKSDDLVPGGAGVRAQACSRDGKLIDDFLFIESERVLHVCNAPSPAATASLAIGEYLSEKVLSKLK